MIVGQQLFLNNDKARLVTAYNPDSQHRRNYQDRMSNPKGYAGAGLRRVTAIDPVEFQALINAGDKDAIAFYIAHDEQTMRNALRKLLVRFPEWRVSEVSI